MYFEELYTIVTKFISSGQCILLLDGLSYLITLNDFKRALHLVGYIGDKVAENNSYFILNANPETLGEQELALLEEEVDLILKH
jgi:archaellum biogenesis ATPase FlaH